MKSNILVLISLATMLVSVNVFASDDESGVQAENGTDIPVIQPVAKSDETATGKTGNFMSRPYLEAFHERAKPGFVADSKAVAKGSEVLVEDLGKGFWRGILAVGHWFHKSGKEEKRQKKLAKAAAKEAAKNSDKNDNTDLVIEPIPAEAIASNSDSKGPPVGSAAEAIAAGASESTDAQAAANVSIAK